MLKVSGRAQRQEIYSLVGCVCVSVWCVLGETHGIGDTFILNKDKIGVAQCSSDFQSLLCIQVQELRALKDFFFLPFLPQNENKSWLELQGSSQLVKIPM